MKQLGRCAFYFVLAFSFVLCVGCVSSRENARLSTGEDYGFKPRQYTIGCEYHNLDYVVVERIIEILGAEYQVDFESFRDEYVWKNVQCESIGNGRLDIKLKKRPGKDARPGNDNKRWPEHITMYVQRNGRDYLHPVKIVHRTRVKKFLIALSE